jgi:hypothetical protein
MRLLWQNGTLALLFTLPENQMKLVVFLAALLMGLSACTPSSDTKSSANTQAQTNSAGPTGPRQETVNPHPQPDSPNEPPVISSDDAAPPLKGSCLAARTAGETKVIVCSTQGHISFLDLRGSTLSSPEKMWLPLGPDGAQIYPAVARNGDLTTLDYSYKGSTKIKFKDAKLSESPPDFGYVVIAGNSGTCAPIRSGTPETCREVVARRNGSSDIVVIPETDTKPIVAFLSDEVPGKWTRDNWFLRSEMDYESAESYCRQLGARIPTAREFVIQGQFESGHECMVETAYPGRPFSDLLVQEEIKKYGQEGSYHEPILKELNGQKSVDFYINRKPNCGLTGQKTRISGAFWTATKSEGPNRYFGYGFNSGGGVGSGYAQAAGVVCVRDQY